MQADLSSYLHQQQPRYLDELLQFLRIPSISTAPEHAGDVSRAAEFVADALRRAGLQTVEVIRTQRHPLIYAEHLSDGAKPTVLCYGHYDVQPPDPLELWKSPPFEPSLENGNVYARGASDDKGQMYMHVKALEALLHLNGGRLPVNVKVLIEGEEEIGGDSISAYVKEQHARLAADVALVSDTELFAEGVPTLCIGLRGLIYLEVEAQGPARDLHSGMYGGAAPNAVFALIELLARSKNRDGMLQIPGIYDDVVEPAMAEMKSWQDLPFSEQDFLQNEVGATALIGEPERSVLERIWSRPTLEVHGIAGGFTGAGSKTVIPARATAKVSMRLVPDQKPDRVIEAFTAWVQSKTPRGVRTEVRVLGASPAVSVNPSHPAIRTAASVMEQTMGRPTVFTRSGGSIPIVGEFARELRIPTILMGFGLPDDGLHSPNEKFRIANYYEGIQTVAHFLLAYGGE